MKKETKKKLETLVPVTILVLTFIFIVMSFINNIKEIDEHNKNNKSLEQIINETYKSIDVQFRNISTTEEDYNILKEYCDSYIVGDDNTVQLDNSIEVKTGDYIDSLDTPSITSEDDTLYETGPVYLQDKLLMRYLNEKGEMKVDIAKQSYKAPDMKIGININNNLIGEKVIDTYGKNELKRAFLNESEEITESFGFIDKLNIVVNASTISEQQYLDDMSDIFIEILKTSGGGIDYGLKVKALQYFTADGYRNIVSNAKSLDIDNKDIKIEFIEAGKSSMESISKDRIIMEIEITTNENKIITDIIIKLDNKNKVFDIDII